MAFPNGYSSAIKKNKEAFDPYGYTDNSRIAKKLNHKNHDGMKNNFKEWNRKNTGNDEYSKQM
jgi:hypothetical protein